MPRFISQHTLACLTRQGAEEIAARVHRAEGLGTRRVLVNLHEGKMLIEFDSPAREMLEAWMKKEHFHFDWLLRIELESRDGLLMPA